MNNNKRQNVFPFYQTSGILTYDGIHPTDLGNNLLADQISEGIYQSLVPEPTSVSLLLLGCLSLLYRQQNGSRRR